MHINNGLIYTESGQFAKGTVIIDSDHIAKVIYENTDNAMAECEECDTTIDASGLYVIPGFIDIHTHGSNGFDFCRANKEQIKEIVKYELSNGITSVCPTTMTIDENDLIDVMRRISEVSCEMSGSIVGINMEGPFISHEKKAAQNESFIREPDIDMFNRLYEASGGLIKLCDIAPEVEGSIELIKAIKDRVWVSLAHTACDYDCAIEAISAGANHVTHIYNGMNGIHHRNTGVIGAASDRDDVYVELIGDGIHVSSSAVRIIYKLMGEDRVILISDSMEATGMLNGEYMLGGQPVIKTDNEAYIKGTNTLAGSVVNLMDVFKTVVNKMNIPIEVAIKSVTANPAKSIGIYNERGSITVNKKADILLLDNKLQLIHVIKDGEVIY